MIGLFRWLFGYVSFSFKKGFKENFLTDCFLQGVHLRDVRMSDDYLTAKCNVKNYKKLHKIAREHGGVIRIIKKKGLPFLLLPLKNRIGFFVGMVCFCAIISFLNAFVWNVQIVGNSTVSESVINQYLENNNLKSGVMWSSVDRDKLSWDMLADFNDFSWVHINKRGTTALVEVNEITPSPIPDVDKLQGKDVFRKEISVTVSRQQKNVAVKSIERYYSINFFMAEIPLYFNREYGEHSQKTSSFLTIKDKALPIGYTQYTEQFFTYSTTLLEDDKLKALAKKRIEFEQADEFEGFEIVNVAEDYKLDDAKCVATFSYIIKRK